MNQQQPEPVAYEFVVTVTATEADDGRAAMTRTSSRKTWEKASQRFFGGLRRRGSRFTIRELGKG
jgi:hypothetical protein